MLAYTSSYYIPSLHHYLQATQTHPIFIGILLRARFRGRNMALVSMPWTTAFLAKRCQHCERLHTVRHLLPFLFTSP